jgi:Glutaredoxin-like domain (DUF836).
LKTLVVYTRKNCQLCEEALLELRELQREFPFTVETVDIDNDERLIEAYDWYIPVVTLDGEILQYGRIVKEKLKLQLAGRFPSTMG